MDLLKKHYERILLAGALLLLIGVAAGVVFKIKSITTDLHLPESGNKLLALTDLGLYSNAMTDLKTPPQWASPNAAALFPPVSITVTTMVDTGPKVPLITLESVVRRPFKLQFKAYNENDKTGENRNFQINFLTVNRSFFVKKVGVEIADNFGNTGYLITDFKHKTKMVEVPGIGPRPKDISELTIKHEGEDAIVLILDVISTYPRPYARILLRDQPDPIELPGGETFQFSGKTYKVIDIEEKEVIIQDIKSGKKQTITPASVVPPEPDTTKRKPEEQ